MRHLYLVSYDICESKRLQRVHKTMRGFGDHLQYSVFRCELSDKERVQMITALEQLIHHKEDQVLIIPLGPAGGETEESITALGKPYNLLEKHAIVV